MKKKLNRIWPFLIITAVCLLIFFKFITRGFYPVPADLLVSFYFPWYSGGWVGYDPWTTHKASIGDDSIRQQIPWIKLAYDEIKKGNLPLWNPYNFSGNPNLANIQAFIFYPLNFLFLLMPAIDAWSLLIFLQFFLGMTFFYLFMRKTGASNYASLLSSTAFVFSSFFLFNSQINIIAHSIIWMPLVLYSFESLKEKFNINYLIVSTFAFVAMLLGGNTQSAVYAILLSLTYAFFIDYFVTKNVKHFFLILTSFVAAVFLCSFQLLPTIELYLNSPLENFHPEFDKFLIPSKNLITFLAPDFFGNPTTNNFYSTLYGDGTPHIGVIPLIFAIYSLFNLKNPRVKFFVITTFVSLLFVLPTPLSAIIKIAHLPILSGSPSARAIYITTFSLCFLAGFGMDYFMKNYKRTKKHFILTLIILSACFILLWLYVLVSVKIGKDPNTLNLKISLRNLIIPSTTFVAFLGVVLLKFKFNQTRIFLISIFILTLAPFLYTANKVLPFSPPKFFFPDHPVISFLKADDKLSRFYGVDTARFDTNFASYYQVYSPEGYGVLRLKKYAQLIASSYTGKIPDSYPRADAIFPLTENGYRKRILDLMGVKYFLDKNDNETQSWNPEPGKFPQDNVDLVWQQDKFKIYARKDALPRYFQTANVSVLGDDEIIQRIYDKNFNLTNVLLTEDPKINAKSDSEIIIPELELYSPSTVKFKTDAPYSSLLFLSDAYTSGWKSFIDGKQVPTLRADYAFRSVIVPEGPHEVIFRYQPKSFTIGLTISILSLIAILLFTKLSKSSNIVR